MQLLTDSALHTATAYTAEWHSFIRPTPAPYSLTHSTHGVDIYGCSTPPLHNTAPGAKRHASKMMLRKPLADKLIAERDADIASFKAFTMSEPVQQSLEAYMAALKARSK